MSATLDWRKWTLFLLWPLISVLIVGCVALFVVVAWVFIPFGQMVKVENGEWALRFPWSDE